MGAPPFCRFRDWDSSFFGVRIASIMPDPPSSARSSSTGSAPANSPTDSTATPLSGTERVEAALAWCRSESIDCVYLLSDSDDLETLRAAEAHGFHLVDVRMTLGSKLERTARSGAGTRATARVRASLESDIPLLRTIAARSHTASRFYADGRFPRERCDELYATWIEKSCRGWADRVFVAEHEKRPCGYLSVHARSDDPGAGRTRGEIGLVAISEEAQGLGFGRELVDAALAWFVEQGLEHATVVTQARNIAAQRLYQSCGFRSSAVQLWHHLWFDRERARS